MSESKLVMTRHENDTVDFCISGAWNIVELYEATFKGIKEFVKANFSDKLSDEEQQELAFMALDAVWCDDEDNDEDDEGEVLE